MDKNKLIAWSLMLVMFFLCGCETAAGLGRGIVSGISSTAQGTHKDTANFCNFVKKTDDWMKEHMW